MSTKQIQGELWSISPRNWSKLFEPSFLPMYKETLRKLSLTEETLLLDAGCGSGLFSHMAINTGAQVIGIDASAGLLEVARLRNRENNFLEEDLENLPFASGSFDVVAGFNSFQYAGNFESALLEATRVLKPGGRLVLGIWDKPEESEATIILKAIGSLLPPPPPGTPGPFALSEDGKIESIFEKAKLKLVSRSRIGCPLMFHNLADGVKCFMATGPGAAALKKTDDVTVRNVISKAFKPFRQTEELYHLQNHFLLFIAEK